MPYAMPCNDSVYCAHVCHSSDITVSALPELYLNAIPSEIIQNFKVSKAGVKNIECMNNLCRMLRGNEKK